MLQFPNTTISTGITVFGLALLILMAYHFHLHNCFWPSTTDSTGIMATCSDSTLTQVASPPTPVAISPIAASSDTTPMSSSVTCPDCI